MKEHPILFSAPMVRAILEGRKTQTRRVMKPQPEFDCMWWRVPKTSAMWSGYKTNSIPVMPGHSLASACPYGKIGDQLWVRENWAINDYRYMAKIPKYKPRDMEDDAVVYAATENDTEIQNEISWRPSIHMPRWASRIQLQIKHVRIERLKNIHWEDAIAEGVTISAGGFMNERKADYKNAFFDLWQSINGELSLQSNPWVWAISFEQVANA